MTFRLFRSRAFWFGIPGLVFLSWSWMDSMSHYSGLSYPRVKPGYDLVSQEKSSILFAWWTDAAALPPPVSPGDPGPSLLSWRVASKSPPVILFPGFAYSMEDGAGVGKRHQLQLPHWILLASYLAAWFIVMFWRWMAWRVTAKSTPEIEP